VRAQGPPREQLQVAATLEAPHEVATGELVEVVLRVENLTGEPVVLYLRGREPVLDVVVNRPGGTLVWRRLEGEVIPAVLRLETLAPGDALEVRAEWDQRTATGELVDTGDYIVSGELLTDASPLRAPPRPLRLIP
jgi:hypothetical protein